MKTRIVLAIAVTLFLISCRNNPPQQGQEELTRVTIAGITEKAVSIPVHATGILLSSEEMKLSFKTGGIVQRIMTDEGKKVRRGDILAALNLSEINAQVDLARNAYEKALRDYTRANNLYADSVATLEQLQNANTALSVALSNLEIAKFNQTHSKIVAPEDGIILKQFVKQNELVAPGFPVFLFGTTGKRWKVRAGLSDRDIVRINPGDSASVQMDAWPGINFPAVVELTGEIANPGTGTYDAELALEAGGFRLAAGFIVSADIYPSDKETFKLVPVGSIVGADGDSGWIYSVNDSSVVSRIRVRIIAITGGMAAIRTDSSQVRRIVVGGAAYLRDGEKVKVVGY